MSKFEVAVIQIRDKSYNIGYQMGKVMRDHPNLKALESVTRSEIDFAEMKTIYNHFAPHLLDELHGLSEGLEMSLVKAAAMFSGYDVPKTDAMGCTTLITNDVYVRNYDFSPNLYDGFFSLLQPTKAFATAGYNLQLIGRHDGVNEHGVACGLHFVSNDGYCKGLSAWSAIRMVLDTCSTTDDALNLLKEIPHAACYNFSIGDGNGNLAVVEATPEKVHVRNDDEILSCVNHFQIPELQEHNRPFIDGSLKRDHHLQSLRNQDFSHTELFNYFSSKNSPVFFRDYQNMFGTLHSFSYSFKDARIITAIAKSDEVLEIDFKNWLDGADIDCEKMMGMIENA